MDNFATCRVCFANNVKLYKVIDTPLQDLYEKLTNVKLAKWDKSDIPNILCVVCHTHLLRCYYFQRAASRAETLLAQLYVDTNQLTQDLLSSIEHQPVHNYESTPVEHIDIFCGTVRESEPIKQEEIEKDEQIEDYDDNVATNDTSELQLKLEYESEHTDKHTDVIETAVTASDSEEDVPLHILRSNTVKNEKKRVRKRQNIDKGTKRMKQNAEKARRRSYKDGKVNAREVALTDEQQKEAMFARAASLNYLNSPHRCSLCYRGFSTVASYDNHIGKHAESSGSHVCKLCFMRYKTARLLRAHARASHEMQYVCNKCGHTTNTRHQASDHQRVHSGDLYECKLCGKTFQARTSYLSHVRSTHRGGAGTVCTVCGDRYLSPHGLTMHHARVHPGNIEEETTPPDSRYCGSCDVQFLSRRAWATHILTTLAHVHQASQTKECPICAKAIEGSMESHLALHEKSLRPPRHRTNCPDEKKPFSCDQCPLSFAVKSRLTAHVRRIHLGLKYNKNLVCEVCGKKCTSGATLRYHQRTHTGERPHTCTTCHKRFSDTNQLRVHARTHTGERPYHCRTCGRRFAQKPALNRHYRVHTGAKPYTCELCSKSFSQSNSLTTHVKAVHLKMTVARKRRTGKKKNDGDGLTSVKVDLVE